MTGDRIWPHLARRHVSQQTDASCEDAIASFNKWFSVIPADSPELIKMAQRLRYQVYCVEHPFEDPADNPEGLEKDSYDSHAVHSLLIYRPTESETGTVRLILPDPEDLQNSFPIQHFCTAAQLAVAAPAGLERCAEISRFAVTKQFRRRPGESCYADAGWTPESEKTEGRRQMPFIMLGLLRATLMMSVDQRIDHLFAVMEPALIRLMRRFGIQFEPIGELVDYHGLRQPCVAELNDLIRDVHQLRKDFWVIGTDGGRLAAQPG